MREASDRIDAAYTKAHPDAVKPEVPNWKRLASPRQIQLLRDIGYQGPDDITSAEAVKLHSYLRQTKDRY